jgi:hypothetical protein
VASALVRSRRSAMSEFRETVETNDAYQEGRGDGEEYERLVTVRWMRLIARRFPEDHKTVLLSVAAKIQQGAHHKSVLHDCQQEGVT